MTPGATLRHPMTKWKNGWLQVVRGNVELNVHALTAGDGAALENEEEITLLSEQGAEFLFFELA